MSPNIADQIGSGVDGEVYLMSDDPLKVIKICQCFDIDQYKLTANVLDKLLFEPSPIHARVYARGQRRNIEKNYVIHFYVMEKLNKISDDESKVFHTILSHEDRNIIKNYTPNQLEKILDGLHVGLDFDTKRIKFFCDAILVSPIKHNDIHPRNIMKDIYGNYKFIDFDRAVLNE
jgi:serine/threonine protein kinase